MKDFTKYIQYIKNTGDTLKKEYFIEDWEPIGLIILLEMEASNIIYIDKNKIIHLTEAYK